MWRKPVHLMQTSSEIKSVNRRSVAWLLIWAQLAVGLTGCLSVRTTGTRPSKEAGGGVAVTIYTNDKARRANTPSPSGILSELQRNDGKKWVTVFRSLYPTWAVAGLAPGKYRVRFPARLDEAGNIIKLADKQKAVNVQNGQVVDVQATLSHTPTALIVVGVVTVVVAAVLLSDYMQDHDLPLPPIPSPDVVDAVFYITINSIDAATWEGASDRMPPAVTSHFPARGALVAARRPRIIFALTEPLSPTAVKANGIIVLGVKSGIIEGVTSYDSEHWWLVWQPRQDLAKGEVYHITLTKDAVEDLNGNELQTPASFSFSTAQ